MKKTVNSQQSTVNRVQNIGHNQGCGPCVLSSEKGIVLVVSLLLLLVATVIGITALSTSTTNVMISGNQRLNELNFTCADSAALASAPIVEDSVYNQAVSATYSGLVLDTNFFEETSYDCAALSELYTSCTSPSPDIQFDMGTNTAYVDVDYLFSSVMGGGSIEFASGYEGLGYTAGGGGGVAVFYSVNAFCTGDAGSMASVGTCYRYVPKAGG